MLTFMKFSTMRFQVLRAASIKIPAFWYTMPCTEACSLWWTILNMEVPHSSKTHQFTYSHHTAQHWSFHWFHLLLYDTINFIETVY